MTDQAIAKQMEVMTKMMSDMTAQFTVMNNREKERDAQHKAFAPQHGK